MAEPEPAQAALHVFDKLAGGWVGLAVVQVAPRALVGLVVPGVLDAADGLEHVAAARVAGGRPGRVVQVDLGTLVQLARFPETPGRVLGALGHARHPVAVRRESAAQLDAADDAGFFVHLAVAGVGLYEVVAQFRR